MTGRILTAFLALGLAGGAAWAGAGFTANGDGTVTENETGVIWLQDGSCLGEMAWTDAEARVQTLAAGDCGLDDGSAAGQWRQPSKDDWDRLFAAAQENGCSEPALTDDSGAGCAQSGGTSFQGVSGYYWSATPVEDREDKAWAAFAGGGWDWTPKETERQVWAVRDAGS